MASRIQVYERLEPLVGDEVAEELAEVVERSRDLVTKDLFRTEIQEFRHDMELRFRDMELRFRDTQVQIAELRADTRDWMLRYFLPLWIGVYGTIAAVVISIIVKQ